MSGDEAASSLDPQQNEMLEVSIKNSHILRSFRAHAKFKAVFAKWWEFVGNLFDSSWRAVVDVIRYQGIHGY
jgi:hypothetical protein